MFSIFNLFMLKKYFVWSSKPLNIYLAYFVSFFSSYFLLSALVTNKSFKLYIIKLFKLALIIIVKMKHEWQASCFITHQESIRSRLHHNYFNLFQNDYNYCLLFCCCLRSMIQWVMAGRGSILLASSSLARSSSST